MKGSILCILLAWLVPAVAPAWQVTPAPSSQSLAHEALASIPFEESGSSVFLPVRVNGSKPLWFILDSGANTCLIDVGQARQLGIKLAETKQGSSGGRPIPYFPIRKEDVSFQLQTIVFTCEHAAAIDYSQNFAVTGHDLEGVIGSDFFERFVVEIDYEARVVRLFDPQPYSYRGPGETIPLIFQRRLPHVEAELAVPGQPAQRKLLLIDSASEDAVDDDIILQSLGPKREVTGGVGSAEEYRVTLGTISRFRLGNISLENIPSVAPGVPLIGGEVLRRFTIAFDYSRGRMYWEPNRHLGDSFQTGDPSGIDLRMAMDRKAFLVHEVRKGSAAERAGLRTADRIIAIDGVPAGELGLRRAVSLFSRRQAHYRLAVDRGGERLQFPIALD